MLKNNYLRFLAARKQLDEVTLKQTMLDEGSNKLLEIIAVAHQQGQTLTVTEVMNIRRIASPSTIHRKLIDLLDTGWIEQVFVGRNRRTKYLVPTKLANEYFSQLDLLMAQAFEHATSSRSSTA